MPNTNVFNLTNSSLQIYVIPNKNCSKSIWMKRLNIFKVENVKFNCYQNVSTIGIFNWINISEFKNYQINFK